MDCLRDIDDGATPPTNQTIKQHPQSRPMSCERLAAEVKPIYAGLQMVEQKCIQVLDESRRVHAEDESRHWQALIALHRTLLHEHHDFLLVSNHSSASKKLRGFAPRYSISARMWKYEIHKLFELPGGILVPTAFQQILLYEHRGFFLDLRRISLYEHHKFSFVSQHSAAFKERHTVASKYDVPARMWKHGIHNFLERLRHSLPSSYEYMRTFLYLAYQMVSLLYENVPTFQQTWIECLGDLSRYRMAMEETIENQKFWTQVSRRWYCKLVDGDLHTGRIYHHPVNFQHLALRSYALTGRIPSLNKRVSNSPTGDRDQRISFDPNRSAIRVDLSNAACRSLIRLTAMVSQILRGFLAVPMALFDSTGSKLRSRRLYSIGIQNPAGRLFVPDRLLCKITVLLLLVHPAAAWPGGEHVRTQLDQLQAIFTTVCVAALGLCTTGLSAASATFMGGGSLFFIVLVQSKDATRLSLVTTFVIWFVSNLVYVLNHWRLIQRNDPAYSTPRLSPWNLAPTFLISTIAGAFALLWMITVLSPGMSSMPMPVGALAPFCVCLSSWFSSWLGYKPQMSRFPLETGSNVRPQVGDEGV